MTNSQITPDGAKRIQAAHEKYVEALRELNSLRCSKSTRSALDNLAPIAEARRRVDEARAAWIMIYQHETGRSLATAS